MLLLLVDFFHPKYSLNTTISIKLINSIGILDTKSIHSSAILVAILWQYQYIVLAINYISRICPNERNPAHRMFEKESIVNNDEICRFNGCRKKIYNKDFGSSIATCSLLFGRKKKKCNFVSQVSLVATVLTLAKLEEHCIVFLLVVMQNLVSEDTRVDWQCDAKI